MNTKTRKNAEQVKTTKTTVYPISIRDFVDVLLGFKSVSFCQIWQLTRIHGLPVGSIYNEADKANALNCIFEYDYEKMVNNARDREYLADIRESILAAGVPADVLADFEKQIKAMAEKAIEKIKAKAIENGEEPDFKSAGLSWGEYFTDPRTGRTSKTVLTHTPKDKKSPFCGIFGYYMQTAVIHAAEPVYRWRKTGELLTDAEVADMKSQLPEKKEGERQGLKKPYIIRSPRLETVTAITVGGTYYELQS